MFTGIIKDLGKITAVDKKGDWTLTIQSDALALEKTAIGASLACSGVCLTVIEKTNHQFKFRVSPETLSKTTAIHWRVGTPVNLEPALSLGDELGGHLVAGHIDGLARVVEKKTSGDSLRYVFELPPAFSKYIAPKGSVALDGVSLTVNDVDGVRFGVNIIPHTQEVTTIASLAIGDEVNFEIDMIARYVERMINAKS